MKKKPGKKAALIMMLVLLLAPIFWLQSTSEALAAAPAFKEKSIEIIGVGETYQLDIVNKVDGSKYKWSSSNTKVARVSSEGVVTSVGKGSATIRCVVTYSNNKTKTLTCKVKVIIPATKIRINNANEVNGAHVLRLGEVYDFNRDIEPSNSSDKTYWSIGGGDPECLKILDSSKGKVQAIKTGYVVLKATAARTATEEDAMKSIVDDAIIIRVVAPSASVTSAEIVDSAQIKVVFDSPIDESTVIGTDGSLLDTITITLKSNIKGVMASDPGKLKAQLSDDKKTLIITASNRFDGEYGINFSSNIKTTDGVALTEYYKLMKYADTVPPTITDCVLDDTGMIVTIKFSEPIDFSGLKVSNVSVMPGQSTSTTIDPITAGIITNKNNYIVSDDKRSLTINLSNIAYTDFNKIFTVAISGIKDMAGNPPANSYLTAYLRTDNSPKPQAQLITVVRTGYYTLTATFDRSIRYGGYATIQGGSTMAGIVDQKDPKKVSFTMSEADAARTGIQTVMVTGWQAYNVKPDDMTSYQQHTRSVNFDVDKSNPILLQHEFDAQTGILTLTYNKEVTLSSNTGAFNATLVTINDEIRPNNIINYTRLSSDDPKVIKLQLTNMTYYGNYTFTLDKFFVMDNFRNYGLERTITISNTEGANIELPGPYLITQSTTNLSEIYLEFAHMLDVASAQNVANYSIPGVTILNAKLVKNTKDDGATVVLTVADGSIEISLERPIKISGVKSYSGTYAPISDFTATVYLKDNKKPYYMTAIYDKNKKNEVRLRFSEEITGSMVVKVTNQVGGYSYEIGNTVTVSGTDVIISLLSIPGNNSLLRIDIIENKIKDTSGNETAPMNTQIHVVATY